MPSAVAIAFETDYNILQCAQSTLDLEHSVASGQCFRWHRDPDNWWTAVIDPEPIILRCRQEPEQIVYQTYPEPNNLDALRRYFQLDIDLASFANDWEIAGGPEICDALLVFTGLRVTRQDPVECLISFLCSSVAPIYRIRRGIDSLCRELGEKAGKILGHELHAFPTLERLAETSREMFDTMGLGFRGGNVRESAKELLARGGRSYLLSLRTVSYDDAKAALVSLPGVGAKIADCVCLFSLDKQQAVPLDVHVTRIGKRLFPEMEALKSLTPKNYDQLGNAYRARFGPYAGWAQQYLFYNELLRTGAWDEQMGTHVPARRK